MRHTLRFYKLKRVVYGTLTHFLSTKQELKKTKIRLCHHFGIFLFGLGLTDFDMSIICCAFPFCVYCRFGSTIRFSFQAGGTLKSQQILIWHNFERSIKFRLILLVINNASLRNRMVFLNPQDLLFIWCWNSSFPGAIHKSNEPKRFLLFLFLFSFWSEYFNWRYKKTN